MKLKEQQFSEILGNSDNLESRDIFENPMFSGTRTPLYVTHPITGNTGFVEKKFIFEEKQRKNCVYIYEIFEYLRKENILTTM